MRQVKPVGGRISLHVFNSVWCMYVPLNPFLIRIKILQMYDTFSQYSRYGSLKNCEFLECEDAISFFFEFSTLSRMLYTPQAFQKVAAE